MVVRVKLTLEWVSQSSHQGEREGRLQGEGLQVGESRSIDEASVMLSAQKYIEIVRSPQTDVTPTGKRRETDIAYASFGGRRLEKYHTIDNSLGAYPTYERCVKNVLITY